MRSENLLMVADSEHDANMVYAVRMVVPDPFIYLRLGGKCHIVMSDLEIDRAREQAPHCRVISLSQCQKNLKKQGVKRPTPAQIIRFILHRKRVKRVTVPYNFPAGLARELGKLKVKLNVKQSAFFADREIKTAEEIKKISAALMMAEVGLAEGIHTLKNSKTGRKRRLMFHNVPLTSEKLRSIIDTAILQAGGLACHTIVAGGRQGCDPHERGHGVLRANEPIIIDVFPRSQKTGYFGDITRTVVKCRAGEGLRRVFHASEGCGEIAFAGMEKKVPQR